MDTIVDNAVHQVFAQMREYSRRNGVECDAILLGEHNQQKDVVRVTDAIFLPEHYDSTWLIRKISPYFSEIDAETIAELYQKRVQEIDAQSKGRLARRTIQRGLELKERVQFQGNPKVLPDAVYLPHSIMLSEDQILSLDQLTGNIGYAHTHPWSHLNKTGQRYSFSMPSEEIPGFHPDDIKIPQRFAENRTAYIRALVNPGRTTKDKITLERIK